MDLIRKLFWFGVFVISTLSFVVLFEHGPENFGANLGKEISDVRAFVDEQVHSGQKPKKTP
jgi:hypothetical protein